MIVAVTTTSSAATLPISIKVAGEKLGVPENIYGFTLPLGNTCGMNGFAMFIGLCCIFASNLNTSDLVGTMLIARQLDKVDMNVYNS